jgi:NTP pyrophosphatase (non-canonical NTP hydrolase)
VIIKVSSDNKDILYFRNEVKKFVEERNWSNYHLPKNLIQALGIEVSELSELFLFKEYSVDEILENKTLLEKIENEIADIFIYLISFINILNVDLTKAFTRKMEMNKSKYSTKEFNDGSYYKK